MTGTSIAKRVAGFVLSKPFVRECMKHGLLNFSALARKIISEGNLSEKDFDAAVVALRRMSEKNRPSKELESRIIALLKKGKLEIRNKISVIVLDGKVPMSMLAKATADITESGETLHLIHGHQTFTIITNKEATEKISKIFRKNVVSEKENLVEIVFRTGKDIEEIPGVVAYLYSRFGENGINIVETLSSWTETLFVIDEKDVQKAIECLKF